MAKVARYYPKQFPDIGELVCVKIKEKDDQGFTCSLLEYGEIDAYLAMTELSKKRIRSTNNHARIGQLAYLQVLRVAKGYVDVSKKNITSAEKELCDEKYQKGKNMFSIFNHLAEVMKQPAAEVQERLAWPLYKDYSYARVEDIEDIEDIEDDSNSSSNETDEETEEQVIIFRKVSADHPYTLLRKFVLEDVPLDVKMSEEELSALKKILLQRINMNRSTIRATVELTCFTHEGIDAIKRAAKIMKQDVPEVNINYASAPEYFVSMICADAEEGHKFVKKGVVALTAAIERLGGHCDLKGNIETISC